MNETEAEATDMSLVPALCRDPSPLQEFDYSVEPTPNVRTTLESPQESVLLRYYCPERPIAIVRPVLIKSADNLQGKCGRYKIKPRLDFHWSDMVMALSHFGRGS